MAHGATSSEWGAAAHPLIASCSRICLGRLGLLPRGGGRPGPAAGTSTRARQVPYSGVSRLTSSAAESGSWATAQASGDAIMLATISCNEPSAWYSSIQ